jgi:hypothetical protein
MQMTVQEQIAITLFAQQQSETAPEIVETAS